ncbi:MAG: DinB family protein [Planctomycetota bacterium]
MSEIATTGETVARQLPEGVRVLAEKAVGETLVRYRSGVGLLDRRLFELSDPHADARFDGVDGLGSWSVRVLLGHLADAELVYAHRIRRAVAEDRPVLANWDEAPFIDAGLYEAGTGQAGLRSAPPVGGFVAMLYTTRQWLGEWMMALDDSVWSRTLLHPWYGATTTQELLAIVTWHFEHHVGFLRRKMDRLVGPVAPGGCCSSGGGCACEAEGKAKPDEGGCCGGGSSEH